MPCAVYPESCRYMRLDTITMMRRWFDVHFELVLHALDLVEERACDNALLGHNALASRPS